MNAVLSLLLLSGLPVKITPPMDPALGTCKVIRQTQTTSGILELAVCCGTANGQNICQYVLRLTPWVEVPGQV